MDVMSHVCPPPPGVFNRGARGMPGGGSVTLATRQPPHRCRLLRRGVLSLWLPVAALIVHVPRVPAAAGGGSVTLATR